MQNRTTSDNHDSKIEVKPCPSWKSSNGAPLGYYPGIFGPTKRFAGYSFLMPAFPNISVHDIDPARLYESPEVAMRAWNDSAPIVLEGAPIGTHQIAPHVVDHINQAGLYRDPASINHAETETP
jgi:hypothetical protein